MKMDKTIEIEMDVWNEIILEKNASVYAIVSVSVSVSVNANVNVYVMLDVGVNKM